MFLKKTAVFFTTIILVFALSAVDRAYSDMLREESLLIPQLKKVDENTLALSLMGRSASLDLSKASELYADVKTHVENRFKEEEPDLSPRQFPGVIL